MGKTHKLKLYKYDSEINVAIKAMQFEEEF